MIPQKLPVSVIVTTFNEARNVQKCLESLAPAGEIIVVDSFSTDGTVDIACSYDVRVIQHAYESASAQWRWILENVKTSNPWIFTVDADFVVAAEFWRALEAEFSRGMKCDGYYVRHAQVFRGRLLKHGTLYPRYWLRVFKSTTVDLDPDDRIDVHFRIPSGRIGFLEGDVLEDNVNDRSLDFWIAKQLRFAVRQAREEEERRSKESRSTIRDLLFGTPDERTLWLKHRFFRMPLYFRPFLLFFYRYVVRLGFLDGSPGLVYHATQALLYRIFVDALLEEFRKQGISEPCEKIASFNRVQQDQDLHANSRD